jgi:hypothetical protein
MWRQVRESFWLVGLCLACMMLTGCARGPRVVPVRGRVTCNGKPVARDSKITFYPEHGRPSSAAIGEDGTYVLTYLKPGDGALVGEHKVTVKSTKVGPGSLTEPKSVEEELELARKGYPPGKWLVAGKVEWLVPQKYSRPETTTLTARVEDKNNEINFDIPAVK